MAKHLAHKPLSISASSSASSNAPREKLLSAARKVFAKHGFEGATVKLIADEAAMNPALISYHFGGKEALYCACIEEIGQIRLTRSEQILRPPHSLEDFTARIRIYIEDFFRLHEDHPDVTTIIHRECDGDMKITREVFQKTFHRSFLLLRDFFEAAKKQRIVRGDVDSLMTAGLFFGGFIHMLRMKKMIEKSFGLSLRTPEALAELIDGAVNNLVNGLVRAPSIKTASKSKKRKEH